MSRWLHTLLVPALQLRIVIHNWTHSTPFSCDWEIMMGFIHIQNAALDLLRAEVEFRNKLTITISYLLVDAKSWNNKITFASSNHCCRFWYVVHCERALSTQTLCVAWSLSGNSRRTFHHTDSMVNWSLYWVPTVAAPISLLMLQPLNSPPELTWLTSCEVQQPPTIHLEFLVQALSFLGSYLLSPQQWLCVMCI